jgi:hypothetical protein
MRRPASIRGRGAWCREEPFKIAKAERRRRIEKLPIQGGLAVLSNIVMAWNTHRLQFAVDQALGAYPDEVLQSSRASRRSATSTSTCVAS